MSETWSKRAEAIKSRLTDAIQRDEGEIDVDTAMRRLRAAVADMGSDVDTEELITRVKDVATQAEGKIESAKLREWLAEADTGRLRDWLAEAKSMAADAASKAESQGDRLTEHSPGAFDRFLGAAKEKFGDLTGNDELAREGELDRLKGQIKETYADTGDAVADTAVEIKRSVD
ncbi:MAG: CsbD family protein [Thermomicrobiales bacterium]